MEHRFEARCNKHPACDSSKIITVVFAETMQDGGRTYYMAKELETGRAAMYMDLPTKYGFPARDLVQEYLVGHELYEIIE